MAETRRVVRPVGVTFVNGNRLSFEGAKTAQDRFRVQGESPPCIAYFRYVIDAPRGMMLTSAEHELTLEDESSAAFSTRRVDASGQQFSKINYNNRPTATSGSVEETGTKSGRKVSFDVTDDAAAAVGGRVTWRVTTTATSPQWFRGDRDKNGWPRLTLTFEPYPRVPVDLAPAGGAVGTALPWLSWVGHPSAEGVQVQFSATDDTFDADAGFTAPEFDSGEQLPNGGEMDLEAVAGVWTGIPEDGELEWTVRQRLPGGWSKWATPVTVSHVALPVGTITNPGATTADSSFSVTWTPPVGQTAWQGIVYLVAGGEVDRQANSQKQPGADDSWVPDLGGDDPGSVYRVRVRWFDDVPRVAVPGTPVYGEETLLTTYTPTDEVAGLSSLSAVQAIGLPAVDVAWARDTGVPDEVQLTGAGPRALFDGTESPVRLWTVPPNRDLTMVGRAVVNGERSDAIRQLALRTVFKGILVVDPVSERGFILAGLGLEAGYGSVITTHTPMSAAALVHRVSSRRGLEGTMTGRLDDWPGRTRDQQLEDIEWLRDHPQRELRWIGGDLNVPIALPDVWALFDAEESRVHRIEHNVFFQFTQARREPR